MDDCAYLTISDACCVILVDPHANSLGWNGSCLAANILRSIEKMKHTCKTDYIFNLYGSGG
jgi:hypothetical protein